MLLIENGRLHPSSLTTEHGLCQGISLWLVTGTHYYAAKHFANRLIKCNLCSNRLPIKATNLDDSMSDNIAYIPDTVWTWKSKNGGQFANINNPAAGATHQQVLPAITLSCDTQWHKSDYYA